MGRLVGPAGGLDAVRRDKSLAAVGNQTPAVQLLAHRHIDLNLNLKTYWKAIQDYPLKKIPLECLTRLRQEQK
jgi:hypothetical protein